MKKSKALHDTNDWLIIVHVGMLVDSHIFNRKHIHRAEEQDGTTRTLKVTPP